MSERKKPFDRMLLRSFKDKKQFEDKLESLLVEEGKRILNSIKKSYIIVNEDHIQDFLEKHPKLGKPRWYQIGMEHFYKKGILNVHQYKIVVMIKQILNKNGNYLLRGDEFENKNGVLNCHFFKNVKVKNCCNSSCPFTRSCIKYDEQDH